MPYIREQPWHAPPPASRQRFGHRMGQRAGAVRPTEASTQMLTPTALSRPSMMASVRFIVPSCRNLVPGRVLEVHGIVEAESPGPPVITEDGGEPIVRGAVGLPHVFLRRRQVDGDAECMGAPRRPGPDVPV